MNKSSKPQYCQPPKAVGLCPKCGGLPLLSKTKYGNLWFCCDLKSWGKTPLADQETLNARKLAHERFDRIWKWEILSRSDAYSMLAWHLGLGKDECHMATMNLDDLKKVIFLMEKQFEFELKQKRNVLI